MKENLIQKRTFAFSLTIIKLYRKLQEEKEFVISKQLLRCGTSIGANIVEATAAQSKKDFLSKMSIASKEARETKYWLRLLEESDLVKISLESYLTEIDEIINILTKIVKTTARDLETKKK
ncbi:four helix bundle protein [Calditrichota bacterium GD2]